MGLADHRIQRTRSNHRGRTNVATRKAKDDGGKADEEPGFDERLQQLEALVS